MGTDDHRHDPDRCELATDAVDLAAVFLLLSGHVLDVPRLRRDIAADPRMIAELAQLWEFDLAREPDASGFDPAWVDDPDGD